MSGWSCAERGMPRSAQDHPDTRNGRPPQLTSDDAARNSAVWENRTATAGFEESRLRRSYDLLTQRPPGRMADLACGSAHFSSAMQVAGWSVVGIEMFDSLLKEAASNIGTVVRADVAGGLPISNACLDEYSPGKSSSTSSIPTVLSQRLPEYFDQGATRSSRPRIWPASKPTTPPRWHLPNLPGSSRRRRGACLGIHHTGFEEAACPARSRSYCSRW